MRVYRKSHSKRHPVDGGPMEHINAKSTDPRCTVASIVVGPDPVGSVVNYGVTFFARIGIHLLYRHVRISIRIEKNISDPQH